MIAETNWGRYFDRLQNPQVQMPRIDNRRQAESYPSLLEDGRGANRWSSESRVKLASTMPSRDRGGQNVKVEDDRQNCPTLYAVMKGNDPDGVYECDCKPDRTMYHGFSLKVEIPSKRALLECITPEMFSKGCLLANKCLKMYMELHNNPPFPAWMDGLDEVWN